MSKGFIPLVEPFPELAPEVREPDLHDSAVSGFSVQISESLPHDRLQIAIRQDDSRIQVSTGQPAARPPIRRNTITEGETAFHAILAGAQESTLIGNLGSRRASFGETIEAEAAGEGFESVVAVPLKVDRTVVGFLALFHREKDFYSEGDVAHCGWLADQVASLLSVVLAHTPSTRPATRTSDQSALNRLYESALETLATISDPGSARPALTRLENDLRSLCHPYFKPGNLGESFDQLATGLHSESDVDTQFLTFGESDEFSLYDEVAIFRLVELATRNLIGRAAPEWVNAEVDFTNRPGEVRISIGTSGSSDPASTMEIQTETLSGARQIVEAADIRVQSTRVDGTTLDIRLSRPEAASSIQKANRGSTKRRGVTRVLIATDQTVVLEGVRSLLSRQDEIRVIGAPASDSQQVLNSVGMTCPDVVLVDPNLEGSTGLSLVGRINQAHPGTSVVLISNATDCDYADTAAVAGATGMVSTALEGNALAQAIRAASLNTTVLGNSYRSKAAERTRAKWLSEREREVLELMADGFTNDEIAANIFVGTKTVERTVAKIVKKLKAKNRVQAVARSIRHGLIESIP